MNEQKLKIQQDAVAEMIHIAFAERWVQIKYPKTMNLWKIYLIDVIGFNINCSIMLHNKLFDICVACTLSV